MRFSWKRTPNRPCAHVARDNGETNEAYRHQHQNVESAAGGAQIHYDDTLSGFGVRISEGGTKSFILTHGARRRRETIGRVGIITLSDARAEAKRRLAEYTLGKNQPRAVAWNIALEEYLAEVKAKRRESTHYEYERILKKHFPSEIPNGRDRCGRPL